jgi:glycosyltransferase involved in cell wall biosynthesis
MPGIERESTALCVNSCHIVPSLESRHGGPSKSVLGLASSLAQAGDRVELLTTAPVKGWDRSDGTLEIHAYRRDWPGTVCASRGLREHLRRVVPDVIHHHSIWLRTLHYAHQASRRTGAPLVVSPRGMMDTWAWNHHRRKKSLARAVIHPGALEAVDGWHATSEDEAAAIRKLGFKQPICVAPNGVAAPTAENLESDAAHWRKVVPASAQRPIALFYSRFHQKKRLLEMIDAWLEYGPQEWLLLVVGIPEEYTPSMIEDYVLRAGQVGRVQAFDGIGHPPPYAIASLFLLPSHGENFGLSIAEALSSGVPALVTNTTPWSQLGSTGSGWCVPWAEYGPAIQNATRETAEQLRRRGQVARDWVLGEFSWAKPARLLAEFYSKLRTSKKAHRP